MSKNVTIVLGIILLIIVLIGGFSLYRLNQNVNQNVTPEAPAPLKPNIPEAPTTPAPTPTTTPDTTVKTPETNPLLPVLPLPLTPAKTEPVTTPTTTTSIPNFTAGAIVGTIKSATLGEYLTDTKGMTLYVSGDDKKLVSSCTGTCAKTWMPFIYDNQKVTNYKDTLSQRMNVVKRADGTLQYAYGEKPLYYYVGDKNPGDTTGNGLNSGKWSIVPILK